MLNVFKSRAAFVALAAGCFLMLGPLSSAEAASHKHCVKYANNAVWQHKRNLQFGCGYVGLRWHFAWKLHYRWCRGTERWLSRNERRVRRHRLRACGAL